MRHPRSNGSLLLRTLAFAALVLLASGARGTPEVGTIIQNQAAASFEACVDTACTSAEPTETVTSNLVETLVQQVAGLSLTSDQIRPVSTGGLVLLPHQLVNLGNGPDRYQLCIESVDPAIATWAVFADADRDGLPDDTTPLVDHLDADGCSDGLTRVLAPGGAYDLVIEAAVGTSVPAGDRPELTVRATSEFDPTVTQTNTDTLEVVAGPVIEVLKRLARTSGPSPSAGVQVSIEYRNTGVADATDLVLEDVLPVTTASGAPGGMSYVAGSGRWSVSGATVLTDLDDGDQGLAPDLVDYCAYDATDCSDRVRILIANVPAGASATVTFEVDIDADLEDEDRVLNDVLFRYRDAGGGMDFGDPVPFRSNTVAWVVVADAVNPDVVVNASQTDATVGADDGNDAGNVVSLASVAQGDRVRFESVVWNLGDGEDLFDLEVDAVNDRTGAPLASPFPVGTLFRLLQRDGVSPLLDTDGSGEADTGVLPLPNVGACPGSLLFDASAGRCGVVVVVEALLSGDITAGDVPPGGFEATLVASSRTQPSIANAVSNRLLAITSSTVDLTNDRAPDGSAPGEGPGPEAVPVTTRVVAVGEAARFVLVVTNTGTSTDSWQLEVSDDADFTNAPLAASPGYAVAFLADGGAGDCSTVAGPADATPPLAAGASAVLCAEVSPPAAAPGGDSVDLYFRALSAVTGASDVKLDRIVVATGAALDLINDERGQAQPGSSVTYSHVLTNVGNTDLEAVTFTALPLPEDDGWTLVLYLDANDDGVRDAADPFIESGVPFVAAPLDVLAVGEAVRVFAVVFAPSNAALGTSNAKTLRVTATPVGGGDAVSDAVTDVTTATSGDMTVLKEQALDADCDGTPDGPTACSGDACFQIATFQVTPAEECVVYRLTATNTGATTLYNVTIYDTTQPYTTYLAAAMRCERPAGTCAADVVAPADAGTGDVFVPVGELAAGEQARLWFGLRVE